MRHLLLPENNFALYNVTQLNKQTNPVFCWYKGLSETPLTLLLTRLHLCLCIQLKDASLKQWGEKKHRLKLKKTVVGEFMIADYVHVITTFTVIVTTNGET